MSSRELFVEMQDWSRNDLLVLSRVRREHALELLAEADMMLDLARAKAPTPSGCDLCGVGADDECSMECPSRLTR